MTGSYDQIGIWIKSIVGKAGPAIVPGADAVRHDQAAGIVTEHLLGEFPEIHGKFTPGELNRN